jgi:hypothetical protein
MLTADRMVLRQQPTEERPDNIGTISNPQWYWHWRRRDKITVRRDKAAKAAWAQSKVARFEATVERNLQAEQRRVDQRAERRAKRK